MRSMCAFVCALCACNLCLCPRSVWGPLWARSMCVCTLCECELSGFVVQACICLDLEVALQTPICTRTHLLLQWRVCTMHMSVCDPFDALARVQHLDTFFLSCTYALLHHQPHRQISAARSHRHVTSCAAKMVSLRFLYASPRLVHYWSECPPTTGSTARKQGLCTSTLPEALLTGQLPTASPYCPTGHLVGVRQHCS